ncbi:MAG: DUF4342 domain-containing protein [bacterium]|nr:DUF4342 domain-containing protein [bacterium]
MDEKKIHTEEFEINGDRLVAEVKKLVHAGNIRRITIKNEEGKSLIEIPLTVGVVVGLLAPVLAAVGAVAALTTKCVIVVERVETDA